MMTKVTELRGRLGPLPGEGRAVRGRVGVTLSSSSVLRV